MFSMKRIEHIEKQLPDKRKALLRSLREHNWKVVEIDDANSDWALDQKWLIESTRENKGGALTLWMFKYDGIHDSMDTVVATARDARAPNAFGGTPSIAFNARKFEGQLDVFMTALHMHRVNGVFAIQNANDQNTKT
ncbi:hypothetical protein N8510_02805 [bacterium]|nr:hypothetical protein [bacterium]